MSEIYSGNGRAFCPLTASECVGSRCAVAVRVNDSKGWLYEGGYRCGLVSRLTSDNLTESSRFSERYVSFDEKGRL